ncbi:hypothetical protein BCEP4_60119 [Burkholderia cepacia]|nr:hypothetical protein BCEP4_60119 [Burkholderia cepacia]
MLRRCWRQLFAQSRNCFETAWHGGVTVNNPMGFAARAVIYGKSTEAPETSDSFVSLHDSSLTSERLRRLSPQLARHPLPSA